MRRPQIFDLAIVSKIPITFARVMFAPVILATIIELADYFRNEIARLRSKHGTWRFFLVTPNALVEIDRDGKRIESGQTISYRENLAAREQNPASAP